jgi:hypothetical protein
LARRGVVGQKSRNADADDINQQEQPARRAFGQSRRERRKPIEQPLRAGRLGEQHHTRQKQIDVEAPAGARQGIGRRDQPHSDQQRRSGERPDPGR